ncbi:DUF554 domain-containing protein [Clostridium cadaveris]|uniref:DUF554 domain-containing protein n=1 Tax=Clostridium cadaveris TaxID=1529 RepID=UPI0039A3DA59
MHLLGTIADTLAIVVGTFIGLLFKKGISEKLSRTLMQALGLCALFVGIDGASKVDNLMVVIICMSLGALIGELVDIDARLNNLGFKIQGKFKSKKGNIAEAFVSTTLLFCVGAMSIVGALNSGLQGDHTVLLSKSILDGVTAIIFASALGSGVLISATVVFAYEGVITIFASFLSPILSTAVIGNVTACGSLLIIGLALNILKATDINVSNLLPGVFLPILAEIVINLF